MSPHEVLVVGSINQDQILVVDRLPAPGETVLAVRTDRSAGGKGANQAVAVAAGGVRVRLVGAVGADSAGQSVLTSLAERGVDIEGVQVRPGYTGLAVVTVDAQGENSIVVAPGANATVDPETLHDALSTIPAQSIVLAQGELPARVIEATGRAARAAQSTFVLNLAPAISLDLTVAAPAVLIVNESELALIAQAHDIPSGSESERAAALATAFGMDVLVTLGKRGALACTRSGDLQEVVAPAVAEVVDSTGAGDAFVGAFVAALAHGHSLHLAVRWGVAAGAEAVQHAGAQSQDMFDAVGAALRQLDH
ncbi:MAG: ribokinase [Phycicoccus sp.]|nr:ribokinase [Phycicoccus sp.]